jgi:mitotic spindle assembly checkpoint protein MAD2B
LKDDAAPTHSNTKDPPPWIPAVTQDTTAGTADEAELHMVRAVNTGIINLSLAVQESGEKILRERRKRPSKKKKPVEDNSKGAKVQ